MTSDASVQAQHERHLNDKLRREMPHGTVVIRGGAKQFSTDQLHALTMLIQEFDELAFDSEVSDLHNFGRLMFEGVDVVWRIEAVEVGHARASPLRSDCGHLQRKVVIMLASES